MTVPGNSSLKCLWKDCTAEAKTVSKLKEHLRVHSQEKLIACPVCGALFANRTKFVDHCKRQVSSDLPQNSAGSAVWMNQEEQSTQTTTLKCSYCSKRFATERLLRDHMRAHINQVWLLNNCFPLELEFLQLVYQDRLLRNPRRPLIENNVS